MIGIDRLVQRISPRAALRHALHLCEEGRPTDGLKLLRRAAKADIPEAKYRIGLHYLQGTGVPASRREGTRWLERAAVEGHVEAQTLLAILYVHGLARHTSETDTGALANRLFENDEPGNPDFTTALQWALKAAHSGSVKAQALVGYILTSGPEQVRDAEVARGWYQRSAAQGCPEGCLGYALALAPCVEGEEGQREIAALLRQAAEAELPAAIYLLGVLTEHGIGVNRDPVTAAQLYRHAAERDSVRRNNAGA